MGAEGVHLTQQIPGYHFEVALCNDPLQSIIDNYRIPPPPHHHHHTHTITTLHPRRGSVLQGHLCVFNYPTVNSTAGNAYRER